MKGCHHKHDNVDGIVRNEPWYDHERDFVKVCHCHDCVDGKADQIMDILRKHFYKTDMQLVACPSPGRCHEGNNVVVNDEILIISDPSRVTEMVDRKLAEQAEYRRLHPEAKREVVKVCFGPTCGPRYAKDIEAVLKKRLRKDVRLMRCGCTGNCSKANNVVVNGNIINRQSPLRVVNNVEMELSRQRREHLRKSGPISLDEAEQLLGL